MRKRDRECIQNYYQLVKDWCDSVQVMRALTGKNDGTYLWAESKKFAYIYYREIRVDFFPDGFQLLVALVPLDSVEIRWVMEILDNYCIRMKPDGGPNYDDYLFSEEKIGYARISVVSQLLELSLSLQR